MTGAGLSTHHRGMVILPGLTSTKKERIPAFVDDLRRSDVREIALFPTLLGPSERAALYLELEAIPGLRIPHVHIRADFDEAELDYLVRRFSAEAFNIHPRASTHPFGALPRRFARRIFVENVNVAPEDEELLDSGVGGICPDFSHLANARLMGRSAYVATVESQLRRFAIGCCHISALRPGVPNRWAGEFDHHEYAILDDLSYLSAYAGFMPRRWASLELENTLAEQLAARDRVAELVSASLG